MCPAPYPSQKALLIGALLAFTALAGCSKLPKLEQTPIQQTQVYQLGNAYGVIQSAAVTYAGFPVCNETFGITKFCRTTAVTKLLANYDAAFNTAYDRLVAFTRDPKNYPGLSFTQLYAAARNALDTFKEAEQAYNVGKVL